MNRRTFLFRTVGSGALALGLPRQIKATTSFDLVDEVAYSVIDFLDDDWDVNKLEDEIFEAMDVACYAYGKVTTIGEGSEEEDPGYLARLGTLTWNQLKENPETYNWILDYIDKIAHFVGSLDVFSDRIADAMDQVAELASATRNVSKFIPLVWSIKGVLDSGCGIHDRLDTKVAVPIDDYIQFFKHIALAIVEILLLAAGVGVAYRAAFRATGGVNRLLINVVGRHIGWNAYSWLLSLVHWGIRVVFAEGMGEAISGATSAVTTELVEASQLKKSNAEDLASDDIHKIAEHSDGWTDWDYALWEIDQWIDQQF